MYYCSSIVLALPNLCAQAGIPRYRFKEKTTILLFEEDEAPIEGGTEQKVFVSQSICRLISP